MLKYNLFLFYGENFGLKKDFKELLKKTLKEKDPKKLIPPLHGALLKNEQDVHLFERLAFISRRESENID